MNIQIQAVATDKILPLRQRFKQEMNCQIVHDALHKRPGWTNSYLLFVDDEIAGYASVAVGGPWEKQPALFEYYLHASFKSKSFDLFEAILTNLSPAIVEAQSQNQLLVTMMHTFASTVESERILFEDAETTHWVREDLRLVRPEGEDSLSVLNQQGERQLAWEIQKAGQIVGKGGIGYHYNTPYGDLYMEVDAGFRKQGIGTFLIQELKRVCYLQGGIPGARCRPDNVASRRTLMKAGFRPCGHILIGQLGKI